MPKQHAVVKAAELPSFDLKVYDVIDPIVGEYTRQNFIERVMQASPFALPTNQARAVIEDRSRQVSERIEAWRFKPTPAEEPEEYLG